MNYNASILDVYDDRGALLRRYFETADEIPSFVKAASADVTQDNDPHDFALVLVDGDDVMKKFAMTDLGNTWLSLLYFREHRDALPEEAQKVAAANLREGAANYGLHVPDFVEALAEGVESFDNVVYVEGLSPATKVASDDREPVVYAIERADGSQYYPLYNDAASVAAADRYFQTNIGHFVPRERREYAVKVAGVARVYGFPVSDQIQRYSSSDWNPEAKSWVGIRNTYLFKAEDQEMLDKLAAQAGRADVDPDQFAAALAAFDESTGLDEAWDRTLPDPYYSTFGFEKEAKGASPMPTQTYEIGDVRVTCEELKRLASRGGTLINEHFGDDFANAFRKDPTTQFEAAPRPQKLILARLATDGLNF